MWWWNLKFHFWRAFVAAFNYCKNYQKIIDFCNKYKEVLKLLSIDENDIVNAYMF